MNVPFFVPEERPLLHADYDTRQQDFGSPILCALVAEQGEQMCGHIYWHYFWKDVYV